MRAKLIVFSFKTTAAEREISQCRIICYLRVVFPPNALFMLPDVSTVLCLPSLYSKYICLLYTGEYRISRYVRCSFQLILLNEICLFTEIAIKEHSVQSVLSDIALCLFKSQKKVTIEELYLRRAKNISKRVRLDILYCTFK